MLKTAPGRLGSRKRGQSAITQLYGWDARSSTWYGPNEFGGEEPSTSMLDALRQAHGQSWYGLVPCRFGREASTRLFALVHASDDCATAMIYCNESKAGPAEIVAVLPAERRPRLREDFAFEFLSFARFLGSIRAQDELKLHEAITSAIAETSPAESLIFSIGSGMWPRDLDHVLSQCVEKISVTLLAWLSER